MYAYNQNHKDYTCNQRSECDKAIDVIVAYQPPFFLEEVIENEKTQQKLNL